MLLCISIELSVLDNHLERGDGGGVSVADGSVFG